MNITKEQVEAANNLIGDLRVQVFFDKLASFGIVPQSEEEATTLLTIGANLTEQYPRISEQGVMAKQASYDAFQESVSVYQQHGYSEDAVDIAEELCKDAEYVGATVVMAALAEV